MLYFSELFGKKVFTKDRVYIGVLHDFLFLPSATPLITKLVVKQKKHLLYIPIQSMKKNNGIGIILESDYHIEPMTEKEISISANLQDQQIVDIKGIKVIRVNDVVINDTPNFAISGIDIGVLGIFRWIKAARLFSQVLAKFSIKYKSAFISWNELQPSELANGRIVLKKEQEKLQRMRPEDLAEQLEHATVVNVLKSLRVMNQELSARVIADMNLDYQVELFKRFSPKHSAKILSLIDPDEAVDVLLSLDKEKRDSILKCIEKQKRKTIEHLLRHAKTPIGKLMTSEYVLVSSDATVKMVLEKIRKETGDFSELLYVYAVNKEKQIVGVINVHELLLQPPDTFIYRIMNQNLILGRLTTPKEIVFRRMLKYHIYAMPIVDERRLLLGIVPLQNIAEDTIEGKG